MKLAGAVRAAPRGARTTLAAITVTAVLLASPTLLAPGPGPGLPVPSQSTGPGRSPALAGRAAQLVALAAHTTVDPGARPDPALDRSIHTEQVQLVTARVADGVAAAGSAVRGERASLDRQLAAVAGERRALGAAGRAVELAAARSVAALHALEAGRSAYLGARAGMHRASRSLGLLGVDLYVGASAAQTVTPGQAQLEVDQQAELATVTSAVESERSDATRVATSAGRRLARAESSLRRARTSLVDATAGRRSALGLLAAAEGGVATARRALVVAAARLARATTAQARAVAAFDGPEGSSPDPVPTILGRPALDASQLAGWFSANGYTVSTRATIAQLARWYIEEGDAEGVRGDLAFAQAVLETGGFTSSDAVSYNNFAGIGHCGTCAHGWRFPSARLGVRAQVQLLRTYAQPGLTAAGLADPPVLAALDPSSQSAEGCCRTWPSLTGVWATDPVYGRSILVLYQDMLAWALGHGG